MHRGLWLTALAVAVLAAVPAFVQAAGAGGWWWLGAVGTAVAAVSGLATKLVEERLTARNRHREDTARALRDGVVGGARLRVRDIADPAVLGVHRPSSFEEGPPPYVRRDAHDELVARMTPGSFLLVVGDPLAGKTRLAYEALAEALPAARIVVPDTVQALPAAVDAARGRRRVLWLDDIERFLGPGGLTVAAVSRLRRCVIVATVRRDRLARLADGEFRRVLDLARHVQVARLLSLDELDEAAGLRWHPGIEEAVRQAERCGLAEYLTARTAIVDEWTNAWSPGCHPRGAALVAAAADLSRAGLGEVLPKALVAEVHTHYLDERGGALLRPENVEAAWQWATRPRDTTIGLLDEVDDDCVRVSALVRDRLGTEGSAAELKVMVSRLLESVATHVTYRSTMVLPFPFQSWSYTDDVFDGGSLANGRWVGYTRGDVVEHRFAVLERDGLELACFVMEGAFLQLGVDRPYVADQLTHLLDLVRLRGVEIRVIRFTAGAFPGMGTADHALLEFGTARPVVRYVSLLGDIFYHHVEEVDAVVRSFAVLDDLALSPAESCAFIEDLRAAIPAHAEEGFR